MRQLFSACTLYVCSNSENSKVFEISYAMRSETLYDQQIKLFKQKLNIFIDHYSPSGGGRQW